MENYAAAQPRARDEPPAAHKDAPAPAAEEPAFKARLRSVPKSATGDPVSTASKAAAVDEVRRREALWASRMVPPDDRVRC